MIQKNKVMIDIYFLHFIVFICFILGLVKGTNQTKKRIEIDRGYLI
jgi:hypothetical protein